MNKNSKNVNVVSSNEAMNKEKRKIYQAPMLSKLGSMQKMTLVNKTTSSIDNLTPGVLI